MGLVLAVRVETWSCRMWMAVSAFEWLWLFFFKQKTAYEMRISDWSSDVCSSDLPNGSGPFGFTETNPIPVNGPIGQLAYLSRLETQSGQRILFHRLAAIDKVDVFEAVTFDGS